MRALRNPLVAVFAACAASLVACQAPPATTPPPDEPAPGDTAAPAASTPPPPSLDAAAVEAEATALLALLPDAATVIQDWRDLFLGASPPCPATPSPFSLTAPFDGCTAPDGRVWAGYAVYTERRDPFDVLLEADATVTRTGGTFLAAGKAHVALPGDGTFAASVAGTWGGDGLADWTGPGPSVAVWAEGDAASARLYGGVSLAGAALYLADVAWDAAACPGATGTVQVRDPGGWWYTLALDADCGGCGALTYVGEDLGRACVDLAGPIARLVTATLDAGPKEEP